MRIMDFFDYFSLRIYFLIKWYLQRFSKRGLVKEEDNKNVLEETATTRDLESQLDEDQVMLSTGAITREKDDSAKGKTEICLSVRS